MLRKWITYDLESTFLNKGFKRTDTLIIEIALYGRNFNDKTSKGESYQALVNPLEKYANGPEVIESLSSLGQHPAKSIRFWVKLLSQKHMLDSSIPRKEVDEQAEALSTVLQSPKHTFKTTKEALLEAFSFGKDHAWIAHNGKAFDSKIIMGNCSKLDIGTEDVQFYDSLPMFKREWMDAPSYSQPILFKYLFKGSTYKAHHALEDAKALHKMVRKTLVKTEEDEVMNLFKDIGKKKRRPKREKTFDTDLYSLSGVGEKSVSVFFEEKITSKRELHEYVTTSTLEEWKARFHRVHAYKKLGERLYNGEIILV